MTTSAPPVETGMEVAGSHTVALAIGAIVLALPGLLGGLGSVLPAFLYPDGRMPMATAFDRALVSVFTWSVLLVFFSPPATLLATGAGVWLARRVGWRRGITKIVLTVVGIAIMLTLAAAWLGWVAMEAHPEFRHGIPAR